MQVGDSKFYTKQTDAKNARTIINQMGWRAEVRAGMTDGVKGWRIWRTA